MSVTFKGIADPEYILTIADEHIIRLERPRLVKERVKLESMNSISYIDRFVWQPVVLLIDRNAPDAECMFGLQTARQLSAFKQTDAGDIKPFEFTTHLDFDFDEGVISDTLTGCFISNISWLNFDIVGESQQIEITLCYKNYTP